MKSETSFWVFSPSLMSIPSSHCTLAFIGRSEKDKSSAFKNIMASRPVAGIYIDEM